MATATVKNYYLQQDNSGERFLSGRLKRGNKQLMLVQAESLSKAKALLRIFEEMTEEGPGLELRGIGRAGYPDVLRERQGGPAPH